MYNAKVLEDAGAAKIIKNDLLNGEVLESAIKEIILNKDVCKRMGKEAMKISTTDVEEKIYKEIKKLV